uniref:Ovule protein n=1 Tax=Strongyloides venezuelensis TaxID=75913 RepID=A0A0K0FIQ8_STRVS
MSGQLYAEVCSIPNYLLVFFHHNGFYSSSPITCVGLNYLVQNKLMDRVSDDHGGGGVVNNAITEDLESGRRGSGSPQQQLMYSGENSVPSANLGDAYLPVVGNYYPLSAQVPLQILMYVQVLQPSMQGCYDVNSLPANGDHSHGCLKYPE